MRFFALLLIVLFYTVTSAYAEAAQSAATITPLPASVRALFDTDPEQSERYRRYMQPHGDVSPASGQRLGSALNGSDRMLYDVVYQCAQYAVLNGTPLRTVQVDYTNIGIRKAVWSAEELRVSSFLTLVQSDQANAVRNIEDLLGIDTDAVVYALSFDLPYAIFLTTQIRISHGISLTDSQMILGHLTVQFTSRSAEHGISSLRQQDINCQFDIAMIVAADIVARHAHESDFQKLRSYRDEICAMTDFNFAAAGLTPFEGSEEEALIAADYGRIAFWVFDDDDETDVECSGYAKAFQYLCDLSSFDSGLKCHYVGGYANGEKHAWNLVETADGARYLVDVTNCDDGRIGAGGQLFMKGATTGSVWQGYTIQLGDSQITYCYDELLLKLAGPDALALSLEDFR